MNNRTTMETTTDKRQPRSTTTNAKRSSSSRMMDGNMDSNDSYMKYKEEWLRRQEQLSDLMKSIEAMAENTIKSAIKSYDDDCDDKDVENDDNEDNGDGGSSVSNSKNNIPSETVHKNKKLKRSPPDDSTMPPISSAATTTATTRNVGNMKRKLTMIQLKDTLKQLENFQTQLKDAMESVEQIQQRMEDELVLFCETSYSPLVSLGGDILSQHIMRYLDEDALLQCEYSSLVMNKISRGNDFKDHWRYLRSLLGGRGNRRSDYSLAPRRGEILQSEYKRSPKYFNTFTKNMETISLHNTTTTTNAFEYHDPNVIHARYYGIIASKARELECHGNRFHPSRNFYVETNDGYYDVEQTRTRPLCLCEEFSNEGNYFRRSYKFWRTVV